jgi:hypothetical protein
VIHGDDERGIVAAARGEPFGEARGNDAFGGGLDFEFAIAAGTLARAGAGMIAHQKFQQHAAVFFDPGAGGEDRHAGLGGAHAGGRENLLPAIGGADAADARGALILRVAQRGNGDAAEPRGVEDGRARFHGDRLVVDC